MPGRAREVQGAAPRGPRWSCGRPAAPRGHRPPRPPPPADQRAVRAVPQAPRPARSPARDPLTRSLPPEDVHTSPAESPPGYHDGVERELPMSTPMNRVRPGPGAIALALLVLP